MPVFAVKDSLLNSIGGSPLGAIEIFGFRALMDWLQGVGLIPGFWPNGKVCWPGIARFIKEGI